MTMKPPSDDLNNIVQSMEDFRKGGWLVALLGGAGVLARMLLTDRNSPICVWIRKTVAGSIIGVLAYFALWGQPIDGIYKAVIFSVSGAIAPEIFEMVLNKFRKKIEGE